MTDRLVHYIDPVGVWSINPYQRCAHRCRYCLAGSQGESTPCYSLAELIPALRAGLAHVPADAELFIGGLTDAYPPAERDYCMTRQIIEELIARQRPFCICTKSDLVCREIDLLSAYRKHGDVSLSLCTENEEALRVLEPGAPTAARRVEALRQLHAAGIDVNIDAAPWIPGVSDAETLIALLPDGATIQFAPLELHHCGASISLLGRQYTQTEIALAYQRERERIGSNANVLWKDPLPA